MYLLSPATRNYIKYINEAPTMCVQFSVQYYLFIFFLHFSNCLRYFFFLTLAYSSLCYAFYLMCIYLTCFCFVLFFSKFLHINAFSCCNSFAHVMHYFHYLIKFKSICAHNWRNMYSLLFPCPKRNKNNFSSSSSIMFYFCLKCLIIN